MHFPRGRLYTAPCGIGTKWSSRRRIPFHYISKILYLIWKINAENWGPNFMARTIFFDFQNAGRQDATRESIIGDDSLIEYWVIWYESLMLSKFVAKPLKENQKSVHVMYRLQILQILWWRDQLIKPKNGDFLLGTFMQIITHFYSQFLLFGTRNVYFLSKSSIFSFYQK